MPASLSRPPLSSAFYRNSFCTKSHHTDHRKLGTRRSSLRVRAAPKLAKSWWFRAGFVAITLLLVWCAHRYRLYQLTRQFNMRFEERVGERSRIARDLHDTLLQSFHGLLLRFRAVSNLLPARPQEAKERLEDAIDQTA